MNKKVLIALGGVVLVGAVAGGYFLMQPKTYMAQDIRCDFDTGICVDKKGDKLNGRVTAYENNVLISDIEYKNGKEDGVVKLYRVDGKLYLDGIYKDGKPDGVIKEYNEDGSVLASNEFNDGVLDGRSVIYGENNKIVKEWYYKAGKEVGVGKVFYDNGGIQLEVDFDKGVLKYFYENGKENSVAHFNDKGYNGMWNIYSQEGNLQAELKFENGVSVEGYCLEENGDRVDLTAEDFKEFTESGKLPCIK